jgi:autotransporter-associated beta strand protein
VTGISVTNGGSAYLGAPFVQITGGGGVGATAVANVDGAGVITSIAITNPGTGYTSTPTVNLLGGEPISAASLSIATGATVSGGLTKTGAGVLTLTGANTYTGTTRILQGTLALGLGGSLSTSSVVEVAAGAAFDGSAVGGITIPSGQTLQGTGTAIGDVTVIGTLAPGNSIGTLNFNGNLSLSGTSNFEFNPSSASDLANVTGSVTYGGILNFTNLGGTPTKFDTFNLFDAASYSGSFATLNLPTYAAGDYWENNLLANGTLTYVPEPGATALLLAFAGFGLRRRRRE